MKNLTWEFVLLAAAVILCIFVTFDKRDTVADVTGEVLFEPFIGGPSFIYRWEGELLRNCETDLRRSIWQGGQEYPLIPKSFPPIHADQWNGPHTTAFNIGVDLKKVENSLSSGPASYHVMATSYCNALQSFFRIGVEEAYPPIYFEIKK